VVEQEDRRPVGVGQTAPQRLTVLVDAAGERVLGQLDLPYPGQLEPLQRRSGADEVLDEVVGGVGEDLLRGGELCDTRALLQDRDPIAHLDGFVDVVGDEGDRLLQLALQPQELVLQPVAVDRIDRTEGLVHQQHRGIGRQGTGDPDALALTTR